jgi:hypothetical protein
MPKLKKLPIPKGWRKVTRGKAKDGDRVWDGITIPPHWFSAKANAVSEIDVKHLYCCIRKKD